MMKKLSHSILFTMLSAFVGVAFAATYYPPSEIVETTDPAAAQAVMKQAQDIEMRASKAVPAKAKTTKAKQGKKKATVKKTKTVTETTVEE